MYEKVQINTSNLKIFDRIKRLFLPHPNSDSLLKKVVQILQQKKCLQSSFFMLQELYLALCHGGMAVVQLGWWEVCSTYRASASASSRPMYPSSSSAMDFLLVRRFFYQYSETRLHSSRMRTARTLTGSRVYLVPGGCT